MNVIKCVDITVIIWLHCIWLNKSVYHCGWGTLTHSTTTWDCAVNHNHMGVFPGMKGAGARLIKEETFSLY
jgi:hypothetical protein